MSNYASYSIEPTITGPTAPEKGNAGTENKSTDTPNNPENQAPVRPDYVPEKFWKDGKIDVEGLTKSYKELEKKIGSGTKPESKPNETPNPENKGVVGENKQDESQTNESPEVYIPGVAKADGEKFSKELMETGQLTTESYAILEKAGYPKAIVDGYIRGIMAEKTSQESYVAEMKTLAGGDEAYADVTAWAKVNLSEQELTDYNEAVSSGKKSVIALAVKDLVGRYKEANGGTEPKLISGKTGNSVVNGFRSRAEVTAAMQDRRYKTDEAFRQEVAEKLKHSSF